MKGFLYVFGSLVFLIAIAYKTDNKTGYELTQGDIAFVAFNAGEDDGFSLVVFKDIPPQTTINFTDSEWNGNRFGADENDMVWNTGNTTIKKGTKVDFNNLGQTPKVTDGNVFGNLKLSKKQEAIFAYSGSTRMPTTFLAATANHKLGYGTLINTGLTDGDTAITFPEHTVSAKYKGPSHSNLKHYKKALSKLSNYKLESTLDYVSFIE